jgi:hypothetical protein
MICKATNVPDAARVLLLFNELIIKGKIRIFVMDGEVGATAPAIYGETARC